MKRIVIFIFVLVVAALGLSFAALNAQSVHLDYYFGAGEFPLSIVVVAGVIVGAVLGVFACLGMMLETRREAARLRRALKLSESEVTNLRALPIKDHH